MSQKSINTCLSIDFKDLLDSSIVPQVVPPCFQAMSIYKTDGSIPKSWIPLKNLCPGWLFSNGWDRIANYIFKLQFRWSFNAFLFPPCQENVHHQLLQAVKLQIKNLTRHVKYQSLFKSCMTKAKREGSINKDRSQLWTQSVKRQNGDLVLSFLSIAHQSFGLLSSKCRKSQLRTFVVPGLKLGEVDPYTASEEEVSMCVSFIYFIMFFNIQTCNILNTI